ncbi:MAG: M20/M25/M40 family metallo-hydrolase [Alphaproteobacteria bacterium]|nr:M20/M25/M40 family metallo-hydrolase [Alphaproteobacteria bacterium]
MSKAPASDVARTLLGWIEADREEIVRFLSAFVAAPSPNPPGDTRPAAAVAVDLLKAKGVPHEVKAAKPELPNVVGSVAGGAAGRHLVLNGHIDVFPVAPHEKWTHGAWSGAVADGKVWGRGVTDMKCGTAASIWTYIYLSRLREKLKGRLTLTAVSDEETGGTWGTKWLMESFGDAYRGDCVLNGEPGTPQTVRFGEKGTLRLVFTVETPGAHAAYTHLSKNAIRLAAEIVQRLYWLEDTPFEQPAELRRAVEACAPTMDRMLGTGAGGIINKVTVSVGVIEGGVKINVLPGKCRFEVDIRLPLGLGHAPLMARVQEILRDYPEAKVEIVTTHSSEPTWCSPEHEMVGILQRTVHGLRGFTPTPAVSIGGSDCKFWRRAGIPAYIYGCMPTNMAKPDEHVEIEEHLHVLRTHALAAAAYLGAS